MRIANCNTRYFLLLLLPWSVIMQETLVQDILLSSPRAGFTAIEADGSIYLAGGITNSKQESSTIDVYNIASKTWNSTLTLPTARGYISPVHIQPNIYFVGGFSRSGSLFMFDPQMKIFNETGAPIIRGPFLMAFDESTLFVGGSHSAHFLNLDDIASGWTESESLEYIMERLAGGIIFSHDNLIFIVGGYNVSTRQFVNDAWIFDINDGNLTRYNNVVHPFAYSIPFKHSVANNLAAVWMESQIMLFNIETSSWLNLNITNTTNIVNIPGFTFLFNTGGFYTVDWTNPTADPTYTAADGPIAYSVRYEYQAAYFVNGVDGSLKSFVFNEGVWTLADQTGNPPAINRVIFAVEWPQRGALFASYNYIYLFYNGTVKFSFHLNTEKIVLNMPFMDDFYVISGVQENDEKLISVFNADLAETNSWPLPLTPQVIYRDLLFDFSQNLAYDVYNGKYFTPFAAFFSSFAWAVKGDFFFIYGIGAAWSQSSHQVDIYNYQTGEWTSRNNSAIESAQTGYLQAFNLNGLLAIMTRVGRLTYNLTSDTWSEIPLLADEIQSSFSPLVLEVNGTAYVTTLTVAELQIFTNGELQTKMLSDSKSTPLQILLNKASNRVLISTKDRIIYTLNIVNQQQDIFLLPRADPDIILASSGNFLLMSSSTNNNALDYCDLSSAGWGTVPGLTNHIIPAVMQTITVNGTELILIAGGVDREFQFYTDSVKLLDISSLSALQAPLNTPTGSAVPNGNNPGPSDNTTLIVAIVVPVGVALIAGALLAFLLVRRNQKKKKNGGNTTTMIGLESNHGRWFIPFNQITFGEQLGQGGSSQVFKGTWKNTVVALKVSMTQANQSVIRELELMMQLRPHPNVVQLLGFSVHPETDGIILVIEFCEGGSLDTWLYAQGPQIIFKQKLDWLAGIAKGLNHLHSNNVVHRDVAARNVLIHRNEPKLTDFGMSRIVDDQKQHGTTKSELGPIRWMSPESLKDKDYSVKSDIWSFGILAFEIIVQQEPHAGEDPIEIGRLIRDEGRTPQLPAACPKEITSVIQSCWQMDPSKRPNIEQITSKLEKMASELDMI